MIINSTAAAAEPWRSVPVEVMRLMNHMMMNASRPTKHTPFTQYAAISLNQIMHNGRAVRLGGVDTRPS